MAAPGNAFSLNRRAVSTNKKRNWIQELALAQSYTKLHHDNKIQSSLSGHFPCSTQIHSKYFINNILPRPMTDFVACQFFYSI